MSKIELSEYLAKNGNMTVDEDELNKLLGVEPKRGGMPKIGELYWYISADGSVYCRVWKNYDLDKYIYYTLNCFKTEDEAKKAKEALIMHGKLMRYAEEHNEDERDTFNVYSFHSYTNCLEYANNDAPTQYNKVYFTSKEILYEAIDSVGGEKEVLRVLYGVE